MTLRTFMKIVGRARTLAVGWTSTFASCGVYELRHGLRHACEGVVHCGCKFAHGTKAAVAGLDMASASIAGGAG